jgi:2-polyprenyl-3-methyl-5-hydroxy-6-metoxy-1,4-benzoquinol methylase
MRYDRGAVERALRDLHDFFRSSFPYFQDNFTELDYNADILLRLKEIELISRYFAGEPGSRVLDVGIGGGQIPYVLKRLGYEAYGLDDDFGGNRNVESQKHLYPDIHLGYCSLEKDQFPFESNYFDLVTIIHTLEHIPSSPKHFLEETYRCLRPGGILFLMQPNPAFITKRVYFALLGRSPYWHIHDWFSTSPEEFVGHTREYTLSEVCYMIEKVRFKIVEAKHINQPFYLGIHRASLLKKMMWRLALGITCIIASTRYATLVAARKV